MRKVVGPLVVVALAALSLSPAYAGKKDKPVITPPATVFLRSAYDMDPSSYLGRFVKAGTPPGQLDESSTFVTECSAFVKPKIVDAGEVFYDEFFNASVAARVSAGIQSIASVSAEASSAGVMRAKYTLYQKMQGEITDPAGFNACCKKAPDMCSDRYIAEFLKGAGATYVGTQKDKKLKVEVTPGSPIPGLDVSVFPKLEVDTEMAWYRGTTFSKPVYFAFKTSEVNLQEGFKACGDWQDAPPKSSLGQYFVGVAPMADGEATGRDLAMDSARLQTVKFLGEQIATGSLRVDTVSGSGAGVASTLSQQGTTERAAAGIAAYVKDEAWCVVPVTNAKGNYTQVKVLAFLPNASVQAAATAAAKAAGAK